MHAKASAGRTVLYLTAGLIISVFVYGLLVAQTAQAQNDLAAAKIVFEADDVSEDDSSVASDQGVVAVKRSKYASVARVKLDKSHAKITDAETVQFEATLVPAVAGKRIKDKDAKITWSVSDPKIARISKDGVVQGKKNGIVRVKATAPNGKKATAMVKVVIHKSQMATKVPVLTYHRIASDIAKQRHYRYDSLAVSASMFNKQMKWLKKNGYTTISCAELRDWRVEGAFLPKKSVLVTMDDGFYESYYVAYPILKKYGQKGTTFVIGSRTKAKTSKFDAKGGHDRFVGRDVIQEVREEYPNFEFQSHTYNMHYRASSGYGIVTVLSRTAIEIDFAKNAKYGFTALAYPYGHSSNNMLSVLSSDKSVNIAFGYMKDWPASRTSPIYNMPRFKVMGNGSLADFQRIVETAR